MKGVLLLSAAVLLDVQTGVVGALSLEAAAADEVSSPALPVDAYRPLAATQSRSAATQTHKRL